jgi:DNA-binding FrmR family transcriptional regulator
MRPGRKKIKPGSWLLSEAVCARVRKIHGAQRAIARMCDIDQPRLSRILNRKEPASAAVRVAIQKYLDWLGECLQVEAMKMEFEPEVAGEEPEKHVIPGSEFKTPNSERSKGGIQDSKFKIEEAGFQSQGSTP